MSMSKELTTASRLTRTGEGVVNARGQLRKACSRDCGRHHIEFGMTERCEDPAMRRERSSQLPHASAGVNQFGDPVLDIATMTAEHARIEVLECRLDVFECFDVTDDDGFKESREKGQCIKRTELARTRRELSEVVYEGAIGVVGCDDPVPANVGIENGGSFVGPTIRLRCEHYGDVDVVLMKMNTGSQPHRVSASPAERPNA
jgi:hypothetical protein